MRAVWLTFPTICALAACGDPLGGIERVSQTDAVMADAANAALPSQEELAREGSILSVLFPPRAPDPTPEGTMATLDETDESRADADQTDVGADSADVTSAAAPPETEGQTATAAPEPRRGRVLGWLRRAASAEAGAQASAQDEAAKASATPDGETTTEGQAVVVASVGEEAVAPEPSDAAPQRRRGLFGGARANASRTGPDAQDVPVGTLLPFGQVARVCDVARSQMGKVVDQGARKGPGYKLFDTRPDSATPRTFYVTGFADNCPRQFTAALALFGSPTFHEQLRYGLPAKDYPYSTTDQAYEKVKAKVCNVGRNTPCGSRISRLERTTVFVSVYENFGENARWADILLHDGVLLASALKTP